MQIDKTAIYKNQWIGWGLLIFIGIGYTWATWRYFTEPIPGGNDFLTHYTAWEAHIKLGVSPYSDQAALFTQQAIYGRPALPGEDQNRMVYPYYSILVHGPFVFLDYAVARAIYMTLLQIALFIGVAMTLEIFAWKPVNWLLTLILVWALLFYPDARGVILGQFAIFGFFSLAGSLYLLDHNHDFIAGSMLVLSTIKPTLVFLVVPFLLLWALKNCRWSYLTGFFGLLGFLVFISLFMDPNWIGDWLFRITQYSDYTVGQSPVWLLAHQVLPKLGTVGDVVISILILAALLFLWVQTLFRGKQADFYWAIGITLVVSNLIVPRSATTNYVLMLVPTLWIFAALDRYSLKGRLILVAALLVSLVGLWWLHFATVIGNQEQAILFIPYPFILGAALIFGRKWLLRDSRLAARL